MSKYKVFYEGGAEEGLSCIEFECENADAVWENINEMQKKNADLYVRLILFNVDDENIIFQD